MLNILIAFCVIFTIGSFIYYTKKLFIIPKKEKCIIDPFKQYVLSQNDIIDRLMDNFEELNKFHCFSPFHVNVQDLMDIENKEIFPALFGDTFCRIQDISGALETVRNNYNMIYNGQVGTIYKTRTSTCSICGENHDSIPTVGMDGEISVLNICTSCINSNTRPKLRDSCAVCGEYYPVPGTVKRPIYHCMCLPSFHKKENFSDWEKYPDYFRRGLQLSCKLDPKYFKRSNYCIGTALDRPNCKICKFLAKKAFIRLEFDNKWYNFVRI